MNDVQNLLSKLKPDFPYREFDPPVAPRAASAFARYAAAAAEPKRPPATARTWPMAEVFALLARGSSYGEE